MVTKSTAIKAVSVIKTGDSEGHYEHIYGTRKPALWWIFFGRRWVCMPLNVYVIEHEDGLVLFDTGQERAVVTDPDYYGGRINKLFFSHIFGRWYVGPEDTLTIQLERAGYSASDVSKAVMSHLHADHVGCIAEIPQADLYAAEEGLEFMRGPNHPDRHFVYRHRIEIPGAKWHSIAFEPTNDPELAPFTEAFDLMGDGSLIVLPTPGHIEGAISMLARRGDMPPLLFIGDLTYSEDLLMRDQLPGTGEKEELRASFAKVRALKERMPDLVILPAHDAAAGEKLRQAA